MIWTKPKCRVEVKQGDGRFWRWFARAWETAEVFEAGELVGMEPVHNGQATPDSSLERARVVLRGWNIVEVDFVGK